MTRTLDGVSCGRYSAHRRRRHATCRRPLRFPSPIEHYRERRQRCRVEASARGFAGLVVFSRDPERAGNGLYLANHRPIAGSHPAMYEQRGRGYCAVVIPVDREETLLVTAPYYEPDVTVERVAVDTNLPRGLARVIEEYGLDRGERWGLVGEEFLSVLLYRDIQAALPGCVFYFADDVLWSLRAVKDEFEQAILREGAKVRRRWGRGRDGRLPGRQQREPGRRGGRCGLAGTRRDRYLAHLPERSLPLRRTADPHRTPASGCWSRATWPRWRFAAVSGLRLRICRSAVIGTPDNTQRHMFETVERMLDTIIATAAPGVRAEELQGAIDVIAHDEGFDGYQSMRFGGSSTYCGHGLGVASDEPPVLFTGDRTILRPGMFLTPEPASIATPKAACVWRTTS